MKKKVTGKPAASAADSKKELKKQASSNDTVKKGYNEKNPEQPQGAFKPDNASSKN